MSQNKCKSKLDLYINCPNCDARIFEKNLCRHMSSNRCKHNFLHKSSKNKEAGSSKSVPETNKSMLYRLVDENKNLKTSLEKSKHENFCAEQLFMKLMNNVHENHELTFKHDQSTQTDDLTYHIDF